MRFISQLIVISALAVALVACGGDTASGAASSAGDAAASAAADASAAAKETISAAEDAVAEAQGVVDEARDGVAQAAAAGVAAGPDLAAGEKTYGRFCFSCHAAGVAGAPKLGVAGDWAPRAAKGLDAMVASTIEGIPPGMPARGLCMNCSDDDLRNAVAWMSAQQ